MRAAQPPGTDVLRVDLWGTYFSFLFVSFLAPWRRAVSHPTTSARSARPAHGANTLLLLLLPPPAQETAEAVRPAPPDWGLAYAGDLAMLATLLIFAPFVPLVTAPCVMYYALRYAVVRAAAAASPTDGEPRAAATDAPSEVVSHAGRDGEDAVAMLPVCLCLSQASDARDVVFHLRRINAARLGSVWRACKLACSQYCMCVCSSMCFRVKHWLRDQRGCMLRACPCRLSFAVSSPSVGAPRSSAAPCC